MLILIGENPNPESLENQSYLKTLTPRANQFLVFAETQQDSNSYTAIGLKIYGSDSRKTMWDSCNVVLSEINEFLLNSNNSRKNREDSTLKDCFFAACILYLVSRASMIAKQSSLGKDDISFEVLTDTDGAKIKSFAIEIKLLDLLFYLFGQCSSYCLFQEIAGVVGIRYNKITHGINLMDFIDFCFFNERFIIKSFDERPEDMEIKIPEVFMDDI